MTPFILGIMASSRLVSSNSYESIETINASAGGSSSLTFNSIPSTYKHLQIRGIAKTVSNDQGIFLQANGDTASNYSSHLLIGNGSAASAAANTTWAGVYCGPTFSTQFTGFVIDILDYANTNKFKTVRSLSGVDNNSSGYAILSSGCWRNTNAITSISFKEILANSNFTQYTQFALYGIKG